MLIKPKKSNALVTILLSAKILKSLTLVLLIKALIKRLLNIKILKSLTYIREVNTKISSRVII